jgi:NTP pyrophosphatase (non-canonical NTP hydrolase)
VNELTFAAFREANLARCIKWHPQGIESWSPSDWMTAVVGELGELASLLKMRNRERDGLPGNKFSPSDKQVADELADVMTYLDLLAAALGVDLGAATVAKFNEVSERVGFPDRIDASRTCYRAEVGVLRASNGISYVVRVLRPGVASSALRLDEGVLEVHNYTSRARAEYEAAEWNYVFGHGPKPTVDQLIAAGAAEEAP